LPEAFSDLNFRDLCPVIKWKKIGNKKFLRQDVMPDLNKKREITKEWRRKLNKLTILNQMNTYNNYMKDHIKLFERQ